MLAGEDSPDLILLDIRLPDMDGFEVCRRLKKDPRTGNIPVTFIMGLEEVADKVKGFEAGGVDYITKSFQHEEVLARLEPHLALRRLQKQIEAQNVQLQREIVKSRSAEEALADRTVQLERINRELVALNAELDYMLGSETGLEVFNAIQDEGGFLPVIMLTGHGNEEIAVEAMKAGVSDDLVKGRITPESLRLAISNALQKFKMKREIEEQRKALLDPERQRVMMESVAPST